MAPLAATAMESGSRTRSTSTSRWTGSSRPPRPWRSRPCASAEQRHEWLRGPQRCLAGAPQPTFRRCESDLEESVTKTISSGLMMDDYPLSLTPIVERAEALSAERKIVSRRPDGSIHRSTIGDCARRARRLASALGRLGIEDGDRVATLLWNQPEHLELYFAVPLMGAVLHTLNPRLGADELGFIVDDAE